MVRLLTGIFGSPDGFAVNDFNNPTSPVPDGEITTEVYTFPGTLVNNGCSWEEANWGIR